MQVTGNAFFDGLLDLDITNDLRQVITRADEFTLLTSGSSISGAFTNNAGGARLDFGTGSFLVHYGAWSDYDPSQ